MWDFVPLYHLFTLHNIQCTRFGKLDIQEKALQITSQNTTMTSKTSTAAVDPLHLKVEVAD